MKYIAYLRKSEEDKKRQIQSIPRQREWCQKTALRRNIRIVKYFEDSRSGHRLGRLGFREMMEYIEDSSEPIGILTWKISRLARNPIDEGEIKFAFMKKEITHIIARDREYREGENQIIMSVDFGQATQYSIELSKDVTEGMQGKVAKGYRPCKAPYGYINDPYGQKGERKIYPCKTYFKPIQQFLKLYARGFYTVPELQKIMTELWNVKNKKGKPFSLSTLYKMLQRRFYCGEYLWKDEIKQGKHKPMISKKEFEQIQNLLNRSQKPSENKYQNYYSGFITCANCQSAITGYSKVKDNRYKGRTFYHYLKCTKKKNSTCSQCQINRKFLDSQILAGLEKLVLPERVTAYVLKTVAQAERNDQTDFKAEIKRLQKQYNELDNELSTLGRKLAKGIITDHLFSKLSKELEVEKSNISKQLERFKLKAGKISDKLKRIFDFSERALEKFEKGTFEDKKKILQTIGSNFTLNDRKLAIELRFPFQVIKKSYEKYLEEKGRIEPLLIPSMKGEIRVSETEILGWSSLWKELRTYFQTNDLFIPKL